MASSHVKAKKEEMRSAESGLLAVYAVMQNVPCHDMAG
jgi:hypothetical protein